MQSFFTLSNSAGLVRTNQFKDKADAICVATYRAESLNLPVKIFEHNETTDSKGMCILVCMPDGSAKAPAGQGMQEHTLDNHSPGVDNKSGAYLLLSNYDEMPITTYYLKSELSETLAAAIEKEIGVELGLYDPCTLHAYTEDAKKLKAVEAKLAESDVEIDRVRDSKLKKEKIGAAAEIVEAAQKVQSRLPEMAVQASSPAGRSFKVKCHCQIVEASGKIQVFADGRPLTQVRNERAAKQAMSEYVEQAFRNFLKREMP